MKSGSPIFSFFEKKIGISPLERGPVYLAWGLRFLFQVGFVVSWTVLIALFDHQFGIVALPYLFLFEAVFILLGSVFSSFFLSFVSLRKFFWVSIVGTFVLVLLSFLVSSENILFFPFLILAHGFFFSQVNIAIYRQTEELFSPSMAQRFFPFIETSVTIGALGGAILTLVLLTFFPLPFVLLGWLLALLGQLFLLEMMPRILHFIPHLKGVLSSSRPRVSPPNAILEAFKTVAKVPFLKYLGVALILQMFIFTFIEIDFTMYLQKKIVEKSQEVSVAPTLSTDLLQTNVFQELGQEISHFQEEIRQGTENLTSRLILRENLAYDLGMFHLIFAVIALLIQLFLTSLVLNRIGTVGTFALYFLGLGFSLFLFLQGRLSGSWLRTIQHGTHSFGEASYHLMYYSIFHQKREAVRLFFEGILKPLGVIFSVGIFFVTSLDLWARISGAMILILLGLIWYLKKNYTQLSRENIHSPQSIEDKINSIEVLSQKGHHQAVGILFEELRQQDHPVVKEAVLEALDKIQSPEIIHGYIEFLQDPHSPLELKRKILISLSRFPIPPSFWNKHAFTRHRLLQLLHFLFEQISDVHIRERIIMSVFLHSPPHQSAPFFLENIDHSDRKLKSICLRCCSSFEDPEIVYYIKDYLHSSCPQIRGHAIIALWKFYDSDFLRELLQTMLKSSKKNAQISAIYALGEVQDKKGKDLIQSFLDSPDTDLRLHTAIALAKMGEEVSEILLEFLFGEDERLSKKAFYMLYRVEEDHRQRIQKHIQREVSERVGKVLLEKKDLQNIPLREIEKLKHWYWLARRYDDMLFLERI